ncbi:MAG: response regulator [Chitinophagaceae bacterium]
MNKKYSYLIIEDELSVFEAIDERMKSFTHWQPIPHSSNAFDTIDKLQTYKPELIFLDWHLVGSSGYDVLDYLLQQEEYKPFIIFMTGQLENPMQLTKTIVNKYKIVDVFIDKPIWENLTKNLSQYINEAQKKAEKNKNKEIWIIDVNGIKQKLNTDKIECIIQHHSSRAKSIYFNSQKTPITISYSWQDCIDLLEKFKINYFVTNKRAHLVVKKYVQHFEKPTIRLTTFSACKIEIVKENIKNFESWLQ